MPNKFQFPPLSRGKPWTRLSFRACESSAEVRLGVEGEWRTKFVLIYNPVLIVAYRCILVPRPNASHDVHVIIVVLGLGTTHAQPRTCTA